MELREWTRTFGGGVLATAMRDLNARHPWSHNDHFHGWILANLPERRHIAIDMGCGRGELLACLSPHFDAVWGADVDSAMRQYATRRCAGLPNVTVTEDSWTDLADAADLVSMIAVLHHLDAATALRMVARLLAPGGRFLAVGLAPPRSLLDHAWDLASMVTNPMIGYVKHPWPNSLTLEPSPVPVRDPTIPFGELREVVQAAMPGAVMRHRIGFRHTIAWTKPY
jgi:SAM-dependent methyltransferase